jgi:hypothetical protein
MQRLLNCHYPVYILGYYPEKIGQTLRSPNDLLIDNRLIPGKNLGQRRLKIDPERRAPLKVMAKNHMEAIKKGRNKTIIDYDGNYWHWRTKEFYVIYCRKILSYKNVEGVGTYLKLQNVPFPVEAPNLYKIQEYEYARLIRINESYILLDFVYEDTPPTRIKL